MQFSFLPPLPSVLGCHDLDRSCGAWARRGECDRNPSYMHVFCRPSCDLCTPPPPGCRDNVDQCAFWARNGECFKNPSYMHVMCKLSCDTC